MAGDPPPPRPSAAGSQRHQAARPARPCTRGLGVRAGGGGLLCFSAPREGTFEERRPPARGRPAEPPSQARSPLSRAGPRSAPEPGREGAGPQPGHGEQAPESLPSPPPPGDQRCLPGTRRPGTGRPGGLLAPGLRGIPRDDMMKRPSATTPPVARPLADRYPPRPLKDDQARSGASGPSGLGRVTARVHPWALCPSCPAPGPLGKTGWPPEGGRLRRRLLPRGTEVCAVPMASLSATATGLCRWPP